MDFSIKMDYAVKPNTEKKEICEEETKIGERKIVKRRVTTLPQACNYYFM